MTALKEWIEALESGNYEQTTGELVGTNADNEPTGYCCLGVAADICPLLVREEGSFHSIEPQEDGEYLELEGELNPQIHKWLGIDGIEEAKYIQMNDDDGANFKQIAAAIRANHPEL